VFTLPAAHLEALTAGADVNPLYRRILDTIDTVQTAPHRSGTFRKWMEAHNGQTVTTIQLDTIRETVWAPTGRTIDTSRASFVQLSGSSRYYAGCAVIHSTDTELLISDGAVKILYLIEL
jgi:hypothetical protein